ncbi:IclR family transcriptional regulator [Flavivirga spongiicola]|uniref:IclR family transcriptional regulator n=1 Tax=Flavivirga spongiicola TaxID=421621 RepID=A0ABU7XZB9_9FLAO|nr:IclR family transcriptional regulator [Flavivirga sp. MEBiC05379]MDO5981130.1 IclR family transcriptional regulator [Flavivirga sp. MEBiC05379]
MKQGKDLIEDVEKSYSVPNLDRALSIVELLQDSPQGFSLTELQERLGFPKSSIFRITQTLVNRGYLIKSGQPSLFSLSKRFLHIGLSTLSEPNLLEKCLPVMRLLRDELKETILVGALVEKKGVLLEQVLGSHPFTFMLNAGQGFHLHPSAPGKSIIAFLPQSEREAIIESMSFEKFNDRTITNIHDFKEALNKVRSCGYSIDYAEELEGVHCVGAPIFNQYGCPISAIWVTGPSARLPLEKFEEVGDMIRDMCLGISRQLGYNQ